MALYYGFYFHVFSRYSEVINNCVKGAQNIEVDGINLGAIQLDGMYYILYFIILNCLIIICLGF